MASGSFTGSTNNNYVQPKITWSSTPNTAGNYSTVKATLTYSRTNTGYTTYGTWSGSITINGGKTTGSKRIEIKYNSNTVAITHTVTVTHNADGKKSITISATGGISGTSMTSTTISGIAVLDNIARATTPTVSSSSVDMGGAVTINTPRAASSFTHDLAYSFAGAAYVSIATGVGTSYNWTTPDLASRIPNAASGTVTIRCITKSGSTTIGTKTVTMTLKVPASVVPTISSVSLAETVAGLAAQFGAYIQGKSKVKVTITAAGAKGSTIKSYSSTLQGSTYSGSSWTSGLLTNSGALSIVTTVTDSRGRTARTTTTFTVLAYSPPVITAFRAYRCTSNGTAADDGTLLAVEYAYSAAEINGNTATAVVQHKQSTANSYDDTADYMSASLTEAATIITGVVVSTDYQYNVRLTVTDWFGASTVYVSMLPSGAVILDIKADGLGIAFGKTADSPGVDFGWSAKGQVLGLGEALAYVPEGVDLNDYTMPGVYSVEKNTTAVSLINCPCACAGTLRVYNSVGNDRISGAYVYITQEYRPYLPTLPTYRRKLETGGDGSWTATEWYDGDLVGIENKLLWSGELPMRENETIPLAEPVSKQRSGIVLVFSRYENGAAQNHHFASHFVPKMLVALHSGCGSTFHMSPVEGDYHAAKYLYIFDQEIAGHDYNDNTISTNLGITYTNNCVVLRYVLGV